MEEMQNKGHQGMPSTRRVVDCSNLTHAQDSERSFSISFCEFFIQICDLLFDEVIIRTFFLWRCNLSHSLLVGDMGLVTLAEDNMCQNKYFSVPTQNRFGPLGECVGYSMGIHDTMEDRSDMEVQRILV